MGNSARFWRTFVNLWSLVLFIAIIWDFTHNNAIRETLGPIAAMYTALLAIYSTEKEFKRWNHLYSARHPGEWYVIAWTILLLTIITSDIALSKPYTIPTEIISTYIAVLGILAITRESKDFYLEKHKR